MEHSSIAIATRSWLLFTSWVIIPSPPITTRLQPRQTHQMVHCIIPQSSGTKCAFHFPKYMISRPFTNNSRVTFPPKWVASALQKGLSNQDHAPFVRIRWVFLQVEPSRSIWRLNACCVAPWRELLCSALQKRWPKLASGPTLARNRLPSLFTFRAKCTRLLPLKAAWWIPLNPTTRLQCESLENGLNWTTNTCQSSVNWLQFKKLFGQFCFLIFNFLQLGLLLVHVTQIFG